MPKYLDKGNDSDVNGSAILTNKSERVETVNVVGTSSSVNSVYLYATIGFIGVVGNSITVVVMLLHKPLRKKLVNYFFLNQCILNLIASTALLLTSTLSSSAPPNLPYVLLVLYCRLWTSKILCLGFFVPSLLTMVALTIERYLEIVHPIKHRLKMTKVKVIIVLVVIDIAGFGFKSSFIISTNTVRNGGCTSIGYPNTASKKAVGATNFFVEFLGPIVVIAFCYIRMAMSLKNISWRRRRRK